MTQWLKAARRLDLFDAYKAWAQDVIDAAGAQDVAIAFPRLRTRQPEFMARGDAADLLQFPAKKAAE